MKLKSQKKVSEFLMRAMSDQGVLRPHGTQTTALLKEPPLLARRQEDG